MNKNENTNELIVFCQLLGAAKDSGLPLAESLEKAAESEDSKKVADWCRKIGQRLKQGYDIKEAIADLSGFDKVLAGLMPLLGENKLHKVLEAYTRFLISLQIIKEKLSVVFFYPIAIVALLVANLLLLNFKLFPNALNALGGAEKTTPTIMQFLYFMEPNFWPTSFIFPLFIFMILISWLGPLLNRDWMAFNQSFLSGLLGIRQFVKIQAEARVQAIIGLYLKSGYTIEHALKVYLDLDPVEAEFLKVDQVYDAIVKGHDIAESFSLSPILAYYDSEELIDEHLADKLLMISSNSFSSSEKNLAFVESKAGVAAILLAGLLVLVFTSSIFETYYWVGLELI